MECLWRTMVHYVDYGRCYVVVIGGQGALLWRPTNFFSVLTKGGMYRKGIILYMEGSHGGGSKTSTHFSQMMQNVLKPLAKIWKKGSEIFKLKTPKCYNSTNIAQIAFGVFGIDFGAQFTPKIEVRFFILILLPPWFWQGFFNFDHGQLAHVCKMIKVLVVHSKRFNTSCY